MKPITFSCRQRVNLSATEIAGRILDLANWPGFQGYAVLPGIKAAEFVVRTPDIVGSRIRVTNTDGSSHVEEIVEWQPEHRLRLHLQDFSPPLSCLATRFEEWWEFESLDHGTTVTRSFAMHARSAFTWPLLWLLSCLLKRAITRHLLQMHSASEPGGKDRKTSASSC